VIEPTARVTSDPAEGLIQRVRQALAPTSSNLFARSLAFNIGGRAAGMVMSFVSSVLLARLLGPTNRGLLGVELSASTVAIGILALGQPLAVTYHASRKDANHRAILGNTVLHALALSAVLIPLSAIFFKQIANLIGHGHGGATWILATALVPLTFLDWTVSNQLLGMLRFGYYNALKLFASTASTIAIVLFLSVLSWGVTGGLLATGLASVISIAGSVSQISGRERPTVDRPLFRQMFSYGTRVQVGVVFTMVNYRLDVLIMQFYRSLAQVGYYVVAQTIAELVITVAQAFQASLLPLVSHFEGSDRQRSVTTSSIRHYGILAATAAIVNAGFGSVVIYVLYGHAFAPAVAPMLVLLPGVWFLGMGFVVQSDLGGRGRPGVSSTLAGMAALITVVLDVVLIPPLGVMGGAIASVCAYTTYGVSSLIVLSRVSGIPLRELTVPTREELSFYRRLLARLVPRFDTWPLRVRVARAEPATGPIRVLYSRTGEATGSLFHPVEARGRSPSGLVNRARWRRRPPVGGSLVDRHPELVFGGVAGVAVLAMLPGLMRPTYALAAVAALVGAAIAWRSVAIPLALGGIPPLLDAVFGSDPLPKGGVTFLFGAWVAAGMGFGMLRNRYPTGVRALLSAPVLASVFLLGLMILRLGPSPAESYGSMKVQLYVADVLIFMLGAVFVGSRRADLQLFLKVVLGIYAVGSLFFLANLATGAAHAGVGGRFSLAAQEYPIYLGRDSATGLLIAIYVLLADSTSRMRIWAAVSAPALLVALLAAGSRGPVVAFVLGLAALLALSAVTPRARRRLALVGAVFAFAVLIVPLVVPGSVVGRALSAIVGSASGLSSNGRSSLWSLSIAVFAKHWFFGIGTGGFASLNTGLSYPHNIVLEIATEVGLIGLIALAVVLGGFVASLIRVRRGSRGGDQLVAALLIALFLAAFVNACFSGAIQDNRDVWIWGGIAIGMSARIAKSRRRT
jgi:O-antigen/teichoic acid export membrane protein/O-antigen ligase